MLTNRSAEPEFYCSCKSGFNNTLDIIQMSFVLIRISIIVGFQPITYHPVYIRLKGHILRDVLRLPKLLFIII
ncbi:MAG: hypothetical protein CVV35_06555 [Methanomicrobiales archaeon HGW-Methanomicrobiales-6]|nr:MAG: hypothetical protein CVV35_06555 [Methanomicrobiales archaeon HGW-Methanomicrobiales-6]